MAYNRELSYFASTLDVDDVSKRVGILADVKISGVATADFYYGDGRYLTNIIASFVPTGPDKSLQLNNNGRPAGAPNFFYDLTSNNVGIGISTPTSSLNVSGNSLFVGVSTFVGGPTQTLQVIGKSYFTDNIGIAVTNPISKVVIGGETNQFPRALQVLSTTHLTSKRAAFALGGTANDQNNPDWEFRLDTLGNGTRDLGFYARTPNIYPLRFAANGTAIFENYPVLIGAATSLGNPIFKLQIAGGAYILDNVGINNPNPTSKLNVGGDVSVTGIITSNNYDALTSYSVGSVPVITQTRGLSNITSGVIAGINSNGLYVGAGVTTLNFIGAGASVRNNIDENTIEVVLRDNEILGKYVEDAQDLFGWFPYGYEMRSNITISTANAGITSSYVTFNNYSLIISNSFSLTIESEKTVIINPLNLTPPI